MRKLLLTIVLLIIAATPVAGQDALASARDLYSSARYDEALAALNAMRGVSENGVRPSDIRAVEQVRSLCLLALGRSSEAEEAIAAVVTVDPFYQPGDADAAPRVRTAFRDVRRRMLPDIATERYTSAKAMYDRKEFVAAADQFKQVITLIEDPDMQGRLTDMRTLAIGFYDLSAAAARAEEAAKTPEPPAPVTPPTPAVPKIYGPDDADVVGPTTIRQEMPRVPATLLMQARERGVIEVIIDEYGRVESAAIRASVHGAYDTMLLSAAADWKYRPATVNGQPVKYRKRIAVTIAKR